MKKLKLVVSSPHSMFSPDEYGDHQEEVDNAEREGHKLITVSYLHGKVEQEMGFDLCLCLNGESIKLKQEEPKMIVEDAIYDVEVLGYPGKCKAYFWSTELSRFRGLIVDVEDIDAVNYAKKCYKNKVESL